MQNSTAPPPPTASVIGASKGVIQIPFHSYLLLFSFSLPSPSSPHPLSLSTTLLLSREHFTRRNRTSYATQTHPSSKSSSPLLPFSHHLLSLFPSFFFFFLLLSSFIHPCLFTHSLLHHFRRWKSSSIHYHSPSFLYQICRLLYSSCSSFLLFFCLFRSLFCHYFYILSFFSCIYPRFLNSPTRYLSVPPTMPSISHSTLTHHLHPPLMGRKLNSDS